MASQSPPTRGVSIAVPLAVLDTTGKFKTGATFGTIKIIKDGGAAATATNTVTEIGFGGYQLVLTAAEMTADTILLLIPVTSANTPDLPVIAFTTLRRFDDHAFPLTTGRGMLLDANGRITTTYQLQKNTAINNFLFTMYDSADHLTPKTGMTVTAQEVIDNNAFGPLTNAPIEVGNGVYRINLSAADLNGNNIMLRFTAVGADPVLIGIVTQV